jgi:hypothetical protein
MRNAQARITTHGPGSARLSLFGRTFVRFEEEKDGGGGGGGAGTPPASAGAGGAKGDEKEFSRAEVEAIVKDRLARAKPKSSPEPEKKSSKAGTDDATWVFDLQDAMDAAAEERGVKVPQGLKKRMRASFAAERPDDPSAWVSSWLDDAGLVKKAAEAAASTTPTSDKAEEKAATDATKATDKKPISDKGGAPMPKDVEEITNPNDLTEVDIERIYAKHGEDKGNELISKMAAKWLESVKVVPDRRPRR